MGTIQVFYLGVSQGRWGELAPIDTLGNGKDSDQSCGGKRPVLVTDNSGPPTCFNLQCPTSPHLYVKESPLWRKHRSLSNHMDRCPGELPAFDGGERDAHNLGTGGARGSCQPQLYGFPLRPQSCSAGGAVCSRTQ